MNKSNPTPRIRSLIFDLFGVVLAFDETQVYRRLANHCREPDIAFEAMQGIVSTPTLITGKTSLEVLHGQLVAEFGLTLQYEAFHSRWLVPYTAAMPGIEPILRQLSKKYRLILLSNVDPYYLEIIRTQHKELSHFDVQLFSCESGFAKPDAAAFDAAVGAAEAKPGECYFIDDKPENVRAADELGIPGHVFTTTEALQGALTRRNILAHDDHPAQRRQDGGA